MKTKILPILAALLLIGGGFVACDESKVTRAEDPQEEPPKDPQAPVPSEEIAAFFDKYLPKSSYSVSLPEFNFGNEDQDDTVCLLINSDEEFKTVAPFSAKLPSIAFDKYTLIIGQHPMGDPGYSLEKQGVDVGSEKITLSLTYKNMGGASPTVITTFYYWGLYPKLPQKPVAVNVITK
jgi:hypothetical protein